MLKNLVPDVPALVDLLKNAQIIQGKALIPFVVSEGGFPTTAMGHPDAIKRIEVGWDGAMFNVREGDSSAFYDDEQISTVLPVGRPGLLRIM